MSNEMNAPKEQLVVITAQLAFAVPEGANQDEIFDYMNMLLIPEQRREHAEAKPFDLIDYSFDPVLRVSPTPVENYDYDEGFE